MNMFHNYSIINVFKQLSDITTIRIRYKLINLYINWDNWFYFYFICLILKNTVKCSNYYYTLLETVVRMTRSEFRLDNLKCYP